MMDLTFNIISFFVMITTLSKDETSQRINLPSAISAAVLQDEKIPESFTISVAFDEVGGTKKPILYGWGVQLRLDQEKSWEDLKQLLKIEADMAKERQTKRQSDWKKEGLSTTIIIRIDGDVDFAQFRRIMEVCQKAGFKKFQFKAKEPEQLSGAKTS